MKMKYNLIQGGILFHFHMAFNLSRSSTKLIIKNKGTLWTIYGFESKTKIGSLPSAGKVLLHRELYSRRDKNGDNLTET